MPLRSIPLDGAPNGMNICKKRPPNLSSSPLRSQTSAAGPCSSQRATSGAMKAGAPTSRAPAPDKLTFLLVHLPRSGAEAPAMTSKRQGAQRMAPAAAAARKPRQGRTCGERSGEDGPSHRSSSAPAAGQGDGGAPGGLLRRRSRLETSNVGRGGPAGG
jgi:hypothetical protein